MEDTEVSACLGVKNLDSVAQLYFGQSTDSIVASLSSWIISVCSVPACSDDTLRKIVITLKMDWELAFPSEVIAYYPTVRKAICLQECVHLLVYYCCTTRHTNQ